MTIDLTGIQVLSENAFGGISTTSDSILYFVENPNVISWEENTENGYIKYTNGFTIQYGVYTRSAPGVCTISLPIAMTTTTYVALICIGGGDTYSSNAGFNESYTMQKTQSSFMASSNSYNATNIPRFNWIVMGY